MNTPKIAQRWLATFLLGTVAPLVLAQSAPGGTGQHGHGGMQNNPQWQECKKQADDKHLPRGSERKSFMEQCVNSSGKPAQPSTN